MMHISVLVPRGAVALSCIEGTLTLFGKVNDLLAEQGKAPRFAVQLVGIDNTPQIYDGCFTVRPDVAIGQVSATNLIVIPAINGDKAEVIAANAAFLPWIIACHKSGAEVASLCVGAFLLAETGLLEGKQCATHWTAAADFKRMFSGVDLVADAIITDQSGIYSSGGALSFWNLLLYLAEKYTDRHTAILVSKYFEIDIDRYSQSKFVIFTVQKTHSDESVKKAQEYIEGNYHLRISMEHLSRMFAVGRRNLERRFKLATGNTVSQYILRVKMEAAKKEFEIGGKNVSEVMFQVGYSDNKAFRAAFKRVTGLSPAGYRNRYQAHKP